MNRWFKYGILGLLLLGALTLVIKGIAFAQDDTPTTTPTPSTEEKGWFGHAPGWGHGRGPGRGVDSEVAMQAAAEALGMTTDELSNQLWGGKTLADLAEEKGIDLAVVREAVQTAQEAATRQSIEQAVEDGTLTQEHADWLLEGLDKGFWSAPGGRGGFMGAKFRGPGNGTCPYLAPSGDTG